MSRDAATLLDPFALGPLALRNRAVMAPMTRSRAHDHVPNELMVRYYAQRASAGLIVSEGTAPSPNGQGYPRMPGIHTTAQITAWREVTDAVHARGGTIFSQLMHCGRVAHPDNQPDGAEVVAPSAVPITEKKMWVDTEEAWVSMPVAREMTEEDVETTIDEYVRAATSARAAGFDGIELHGANGYLIEQFLSPHTNRRDDAWGGDVERRLRFATEVTRRCCDAIGADRVGIRLSPYGTLGEMVRYDAIDATYTRLAERLDALGVAYVHLCDHATFRQSPLPDAMKERIRATFGGPLILAGGYDLERANADLSAGRADLIGFARAFLANPDLVERFARGSALNEADPDTFYTAGAEGYVDYPTLD